MKVVILDSGVLINLSLSGMLYIIEEFEKVSETKFVITESVKFETVDRPVGVPRFELGALRVKSLIESKKILLPVDLEIDKSELDYLTQDLLDKANRSFQASSNWLQIVSKGEISCLALSKLLTERKVENVIAIDERTTRVLCEKPENLERILSGKFHARVTMNRENLKDFTRFKFIRTAELLYVAVKKNIIHLKDPRALEAALYASKYNGTSISWDEINEMKKL